MSGGFVASSMAAALLPFEETLSLVAVTKTRSRGTTASEEAEPVSFLGVIATADEFKQMIADGGVMSASKHVLAIAAPSVDVDGDSITIDKDALITSAAGVQFKIVKRIGETDRFGVLLFEMTEAR